MSNKNYRMLKVVLVSLDYCCLFVLSFTDFVEPWWVFRSYLGAYLKKFMYYYCYLYYLYRKNDFSKAQKVMFKYNTCIIARSFSTPSSSHLLVKTSLWS